MPKLYFDFDKPVNVKALYYMPTRGKVDLINLHAALHDVMVKYGTLPDDDCRVIVSTDGSRVRYDKDNPRTEVTITETQNELTEAYWQPDVEKRRTSGELPYIKEKEKQ
jgi:Holliday junction resolvase RusA-like endonuclease